MKINNNKKLLRKYMSEKRNQLSYEEVCFLSDRIAYHFIHSRYFQDYNHICVYQAFRNEVLCDEIIKYAYQNHKHVYVPIIDMNTKSMEFYEIDKNTTWKKNDYGINEPVIDKNTASLSEKAVILMPGLLFDRERHRIGYGGGYYDKYLNIHKEHFTVGLCYYFQVMDELPYEEYDITPNLIFTENGPL